MYFKFKSNMKHLFVMMDDETRFRIAQMVADHKGTSDVRPMFKEAMERTGKKPKTLISDGAWNFTEANKKYWTRYKDDRTTHIREIQIAGEVHDNKMERQNGEVMPGLKREDSPVASGFQIFRNYFRPHGGLDGKTSADAAGIKIKGTNPYITMIQNAFQPRDGR